MPLDDASRSFIATLSRLAPLQALSPAEARAPGARLAELYRTRCEEVAGGGYDGCAVTP